METLTLLISLLLFAGLFWLHRRALARAYTAGRADERADRDARKRHGLAALPEDKPPT